MTNFLKLETLIYAISLFSIILGFYFYAFITDNKKSYTDFVKTEGRVLTTNFDKLSTKYLNNSFLVNVSNGVQLDNFDDRMAQVIEYVKSNDLNKIEEYYVKKEFLDKVTYGTNREKMTTDLRIKLVKNFVSMSVDTNYLADARSYSVTSAGNIVTSDFKNLNLYVNAIQEVSPFSGLFSIYYNDLDKFIAFLENGHSTFPNFNLA